MLAEALAAAEAAGVAGKDVTPFILGRFHERTDGESLRVNVDLVLRNAGARGADRGGPRRGLSRAAAPLVVRGRRRHDRRHRPAVAAPLAAGSDTPAEIVLRPGGSAANTAAWLGHLGVPVVLVGRVGDDALGARRGARPCATTA